MASRLIVDRNALNTNGDMFSQVFYLARGVNAIAYIQLELSGTLTGDNTIEVVLQSTPNPHNRDNAIFFDEEDKASFPKLLFTAEEINSAGTDGITKKVHISDDYGTGRLKFTRAGLGSNTFSVSSWMGP